MTRNLSRGTIVHRILLAVAAVLIAVPGLRLLVGTTDYVEGKDNLVLTPDLHSELDALGAIFVAAAIALAGGAISTRFRLTATVVGVGALFASRRAAPDVVCDQ